MDPKGARWVAAGLCLPRLAAPSAELTGSALRWLSVALGELGALPPPGFVIDCALLLGGAPLDTTRAPGVSPPRLRTALARYEDGVLGRLAADRHLPALRDAFARIDERSRATAIGIVVANIAGRASAAVGASVEPGILRKLSRRPPDEVLSFGFETWRVAPEVLDVLAASYEALLDLTRATSSLLRDADVFTLENIEVLREMGQRVAISQIVNAAEALGRSWPRSIKVRPRDAGAAPTALEDESAYPAGGFTAVGTTGTLENLVTSELVYMTSREHHEHVDLFDVRYAEGELLYYTRDEALIVRPRRLCAFILTPSLETSRLKDADVPWQRIVVMLGWMLAATRSLERWLGDSDLRFLYVLEREDTRPAALKHERGLLPVLLAEWRDKGSAEVLVAPREQWQSRLTEELARSEVRAVILSSEPCDDAPPFPSYHLSGAARSWEEWCAAGLDALKALL